MEPESKAATLTNSLGWQRRLGIILVIAAFFVGLFGVMQAVAYFTREPELVYPPEHPFSDPRLREVKIEIEGRPVHPELIKLLERMYGPDRPCTRGQKYGAVCQDGTITSDGTESACLKNGGVKGWV
jgi:hypothetical protein